MKYFSAKGEQLQKQAATVSNEVGRIILNLVLEPALR